MSGPSGPGGQPGPFLFRPSREGAGMLKRILIGLTLLALPCAAHAADTNILIPTGQRLDAWDVSVSGTTVLRQRMQISGAAAADIAPVSSTAGLYVSPRDASGNAYSSALVGAVRTYPVTLYDASGTQIATFGGTSLGDGDPVVRGTTRGTPLNCAYETSNPSVSAGNQYIARCDDLLGLRVGVPHRGVTLHSRISTNDTNAVNLSAT